MFTPLFWQPSVCNADNGYGPTNEPPMTNYTAGQPINKSISLTSGDIPMHQYIQDGSLEASKFKAGYN